MIYEVAAAVDHIVALIQGVERQTPVATEALAGFASTLKDALEKRCQKCWKPADPEWGSAQRSVAWQLHAGGEGGDLDLLRAFASVVHAHAEEGELILPHQPKVVDLALQWLPVAFTLWIDPGCVAVRNGSGPGASRSSYDFDHLKSACLPSSVHVVWGQMVAHPADRQGPQLTVSGAARSIPIVKPTPTVGLARYPVQVMSNARPSAVDRKEHGHLRTLSSSSSSASSSYHGLVRSASLSSTHTVSTDATSLSGHDSEFEACPSLGSPSSSASISLPSSQCTPSTDNDGESVHDTTIGNTTHRFAGVRLFGDDDEDDDGEQDAGDVTINASRPLLGLNLAKSHMLGANLMDPPTQSSMVAKPLVAMPVKCNYTTHDNGNVGVLGGGVRLGGSSVKTNQPRRHRQHSNSKSISHLQNALHNQLMPAYMPRSLEQSVPHQLPRQLHHMNTANYSAPMRTVPLPPVLPHTFQGRQSHLGFQPQQQQQYNFNPAHGAHGVQRTNMLPFGRPSQLPLPMPYGFRTPATAQQPQPQPQQQQQFTQHVAQQMAVGTCNNLVEGENEAGGDKNGMGRRRLRSRGRRSRGRGAGRAARRQAAALGALGLESTDQLDDFELDNDNHDFISRCSTPATTTSCYSSTTCSPTKQPQPHPSTTTIITGSARLSHKSSKTNLFGTINKDPKSLSNHHSMVQFNTQLHSDLSHLEPIIPSFPLASS